MSFRRRFLSLVMENRSTGVYSLRRVDVSTGNNSLFYPTTEAAVARGGGADVFHTGQQPDAWPEGADVLRKLKRVRTAPELISFRPTPSPRFTDRAVRSLDALALSDGETVLVDRHSRAAFLYDADARRVDAMPGLRAHEGWPALVYLPVVKGNGDAAVYVLDRTPAWTEDTAETMFKFQAFVHRAPRDCLTPATTGTGGSNKRWYCEDLPTPPYAGNPYYNNYGGAIESYGMITGADGADVIFVSTELRGVYFFDTTTCRWSDETEDWWHWPPPPFEGKFVHDPDLGLWFGFNCNCICTTSNMKRQMDATSEFFLLPTGWDKTKEAQIVGLGSGKFCIAQFLVDTVIEDSDEDVGDREDMEGRFALLTGVEVVRGSRYDGHKLQIVLHKSKCYMLTKDNTIKFVL